jgi:hypothetical protein
MNALDVLKRVVMEKCQMEVETFREIDDRFRVLKRELAALVRERDGLIQKNRDLELQLTHYEIAAEMEIEAEREADEKTVPLKGEK